MAISFFVIVACMGVFILAGFSKNYNNDNGSNANLPNGLYIAKPRPTELEQRQPKVTTNLVKYALIKINEDRSKFNLPPVQLSHNMAAQIQAEEILKSKNISHWTTDGMKPYMTYSAYNGSGGISQNVAAESSYGATINPYSAVDAVEWDMMYNDTICCKNLHREDILYKGHTDVSIGIAYDQDYFTIVQNFENNYINLHEPLIQSNNKHIQISGQLLSNISSNKNLYAIDIYYDETPTHLEYVKHKADKAYRLGKLVGFVFSPQDFNEWFEYIREKIYYAMGISLSNYSPIPADKWQADGKSLDIEFDISPLLRNDGVYTVVTYFEDEEKNLFPVTSYSIFVKRVL
jgi:uncharacterized protein YkwD